MRRMGRAPLCLREAVLGILGRPFRSLLVLQAIVWGSAATIFPQALVEGTRQAILTRSGEFALDRIVVTSPRGPVLDAWEAIDALKRAVPAVRAAAGMTMVPHEAHPVVGVDGANLDARRLLVTDGRSFTAAELRDGARVCLLEAKAAEDMFGTDRAVGRTLTLHDGAAYRVVGVLAPAPSAGADTDVLGLSRGHALTALALTFLAELGVRPPQIEWLGNGASVLVPWRCVTQSPAILLLRVDPDSAQDAADAVERFFGLQGREVLMYSNIALAVFLRPEMDAILAFTRDVFLLCLIMGILVVANVMLIAVNARTQEIAIRRCEGATRGDIMLQFVLETGVFCTLGALLGIPLGLALAWLRVSLEPSALVTWALPWGHAMFVVAVVLAGGLTAGLAPAWRAARLDPAEVLARA